jgi:hypothetical protein
MAKQKAKRQGVWQPTVFFRWSVNDDLQQKWVRQRYSWNPVTSSYRSWQQEEWRNVPEENPLATPQPQDATP